MRTDWRDLASCAEIGPGPFDGEEWESEDQAWLHAVCLGCPVTRECFSEAVSDEWGHPLEERQGFRAGTTPHHRWLLELGVTADMAGGTQ